MLARIKEAGDYMTTDRLELLAGGDRGETPAAIHIRWPTAFRID